MCNFPTNSHYIYTYSHRNDCEAIRRLKQMVVIFSYRSKYMLEEVFKMFVFARCRLDKIEFCKLAIIDRKFNLEQDL